MSDSKPRGKTVHEFLFRWRFLLLAALIAHFIAVHYFFLGFVTWDGFGHRVPPVVELVQHGSYGLDKYRNWTLVGFQPFLELTNAPFLLLFGQTGLLFAFALTMFPFCISAVYLLLRELSGDTTTAFYAAATYVLIPLVNAQVFSGYVDWAIPGVISFFIFRLLVIGRENSSPRSSDYALFAVATFLFTMARQQAPYLAVVFFGIVGTFLFVERRDGGLSLTRRRVIVRALAAFAVGIALPLSLQVSNFIHHGSPIYPFRFELLGLKLGDGVSMRRLFEFGGLPEYSLRGFWKATVDAYFVPATWPYCFFDGRNMGVSVFVITALATLPLTIPRMNVRVRTLLVALVALAFAAKDFWMPRYSYGVLLSTCICNGYAVSALLERSRLKYAYGVAIAVLALHAFRPEWDAWRMREGDHYPRLNVTASRFFIPGRGTVDLFPDVHAQFVIAEAPGNSFALPLYGRKLTNTVITAVARESITPDCKVLHDFESRGPNVLVVDDENLTKDCPRTCVIPGSWRCMAFRLDPARSPTR
jgi:hypothetical protein